MHKSILLSPDGADGAAPPTPPDPTPQDFRDLVKRVDALEAQVNPKWAGEKSK